MSEFIFSPLKPLYNDSIGIVNSHRSGAQDGLGHTEDLAITQALAMALDPSGRKGMLPYERVLDDREVDYSVLKIILADPLKVLWPRLANNNFLPKDAYEHLATYGNSEVLKNLTKNQNAIVCAGDKLANSYYEDVRVELTKSQFLTERLEYILAADTCEEVLLSLTKTVKSPEAIKALYNNGSSIVKHSLVVNSRHLPKEVAVKIIEEGDADICAALAGREWVPPEISNRLSFSSDIKILKALASSGGLTPEGALRLAKHGVDSIDIELVKNITLNTTTFTEVIHYLSKNASENVQKYILLHRSIVDTDTVKNLLESKYEDVVTLAERRLLSMDLKLFPPQLNDGKFNYTIPMVDIPLNTLPRMTKEELLDIVENPLTAAQQLTIVTIADVEVVEKLLNSNNFIYSAVKGYAMQLHESLDIIMEKAPTVRSAAPTANFTRI